jgi:hypothetical protein
LTADAPCRRPPPPELARPAVPPVTLNRSKS